ncbi:SPOC domain-like protein [Testicularia cyperi]|uniref:ATP-dependent DNA helicase II subunit 2 n=1 Tax=Testicularia cyperi TaxID=1882483 RepID=A0A317XWW6_9BASI|nr:SPOC domain-like protein [Testicularia cyperi]
MSVESNSITIFVLDISAPMGAARDVEDRIVNHMHSIETRTRTTTNLQWVCEFVSTRIAEVILRGLKTTRIGIITYGSPRTNNIINDSGIPDEYHGIDEIFTPALPTLDTLDLVQSLRAVSESDNIAPGDPLAALVDAIQLSCSPDKGGIKETQRNTWKRTIYLVTDGESKFSWDGADAIGEKIALENIHLRLLGIDFYDPNATTKSEPKSEQTKSETKRNNEKFWHDFLAKVDNSGFATASSAVSQATMPNLQVTKPAPAKTVLSFGDPHDLTESMAIQVPVSLYKITDVARPMTQAKISKLARESAGAQRERARYQARQNDIHPSSTPSVLSDKGARDDTEEHGDRLPSVGSGVVYRADVKRDYFLLDQLAATQQNAKKQPEPLPPGSEDKFTRAWKLGASLIPVPEESFGNMDTHKSLEILHFFQADTYRREYNMDQIWFVFADPAQIKAQVQLSSLIRAMVEANVLAVVRLVRKDGGEPELGVLRPQSEEHNEYLIYTKAPFREDLRRFLFPPLDRVVTTEGIEVRQGPTIPSPQDLDAMDELVDCLDLDSVTSAADDQKSIGWFDVMDSFNPAIHGLKTAVRYRFIHPDDATLPGPHPELVKYLEAPHEIRVRAAEAAQKCRERFRIAYVPPKGNAGRKRQTLDALREDRRPSTSNDSTEAAVAATHNGARKALRGDHDTADEEVSLGAPAKPETLPASQAAAQKEGAKMDEKVEPAQLLDLADPVSQFSQLVESDDVTKAVVRLQDTIQHLLSGPSPKYDLVIAGLASGKRAAQEYEEAIRWNSFIRGLKRKLLDSHRQFWDERIKGHYELGLVTESDDEAGQSDVGVQDARDFIETDEI